ncbi:hypothetical protein BC936DRAFT_139572 [Jimgerdemannia flammicorona]|uniref:Uncharacterized protein n=1 Tax=Jimgerdemannia flammicorona TaxID=994334 RepID=A0A433DHR0_9FUNG|nr:hypothetical protein BC936DRAFT_139572 [Jimgerdemannia flammicorona]
MMNLRDVDPRYISNFGHMLRAASLEDVIQDQCSLPFGWGPPEIAEASRKNAESFFGAMKPHMLMAMGITEEEYDKLVDDAADEFSSHKTYIYIDFAYGRKPLAGGGGT